MKAATCIAPPPPKCLASTPEEVSANQRRAAKAINFGLMYGMSAFGLARQLGVDRGEASDYMARYFSRYPGVRAFMDATREQAHRDGYVADPVRSPAVSGRTSTRATRPCAPAPNAPPINAPMQGTAADIIKRAMIAVRRLAARARRCAHADAGAR